MKENRIRIRKSLQRLLFPVHCPLCDRILGRHEELVCESCAGKEKAQLRSFGFGCAPFSYAGAVRQSVKRFKYSGRVEYADYFAERILHTCGTQLRSWNGLVLIPVPVHHTRLLQRGYNQAEVLVHALSRRTGIPCASHTVIRRRKTQPQNGLGVAERRENVKGAFALRKRAKLPESVILVDDIYTTGSTLGEIRKLLRESGVREIHAVCVCVAIQEPDVV